MGQPLPKTDLQSLLQPGLCHNQGEKYRDNHEKDLELEQEGGGVASLNGIKEGAIPLVQAHLAEHIGDQHDHDREDETQDRPAPGTPQHVTEERVKLPYKGSSPG
ncbi:hypothetical protein MAE02_20950 [Microvirga aerophila]|uniref:Uncharacterized protein n=1 Tax=Microvirga aerophila TaxID=670291 RepID=A0A512BQX4_9HYPH|nr:hypothetical protein MAE02_20950 [Microvirga aerophila]